MVIWFTGLSGSGKTTLANALKYTFDNQGRKSIVLDGDNLRKGLCSDLKLSPEDRTENCRRIAEVAKLLSQNNIIAIVSLISPYKKDRDFARSIVPKDKFIEVYLSTPIEICEQRDAKGLYAKARNGEIKDMTGISSPYEIPENADIVLDTDKTTVVECVESIIIHRLIDEYYNSI